MRSGETLRCDFGVPARGEAGFVRPAIVVTADEILEYRQHAIAVVPCSSRSRGWLTEIDVGEYGVAQAHLITTVSVDRVVEETGTTIGPTALAQTREVLGDLPGIIA